MPQDAVEAIILRNNFYRDNFRRLVVITLLLICLCLGLSGLVYHFSTSCPRPTYFATTASGDLIKMIPLNEPNLSQGHLLEWASNAAMEAFNYNFVNYRDALQKMRGSFTSTGYDNYIKALHASDNMNSVINKKLVVSAVPTSPPVVLQEGLAGKVYAWRVQIPLLISYQSANTSLTQNIVLTMLITRLDTLTTPQGIGIAQFMAQDGTPQ
jgi:intracellular multiplication protein IcmL